VNAFRHALARRGQQGEDHRAVALAGTVQTKGIRDLWHHGEASVRRQLLSALFDRLIVRDGEIVEYVSRADRAAEVIAVVEQAIGPSGTIEAPQTEYG
jgi:hypothetical protein